MATRLALLCHASTAALRTAGFAGDETLDGPGRRSLEAFPRSVCRADRTWASPARCAAETAAALGLQPGIDPALRDWDHGRWSGRRFADVLATEPDAVAAWLQDPATAPHGGETMLTLIARVGSWLDNQNGTPGRVLAITHASVIRAAIVHAIGAGPGAFRRIDVAPVSLTRLSGADGRWNLVSIGHPAHAVF